MLSSTVNICHIDKITGYKIIGVVGGEYRISSLLSANTTGIDNSKKRSEGCRLMLYMYRKHYCSLTVYVQINPDSNAALTNKGHSKLAILLAHFGRL